MRASAPEHSQARSAAAYAAPAGSTGTGVLDGGRAPRPLAVEIAVQSVSGVETALEQGADRIELCTALSVGGMTPSMGLVEAAVERAARRGRHAFVNVLVRTREGGFVYHDDDLDVMERDVLAARRAGASGVVIGALTVDGLIDHRAVGRLKAAAGGMQVTFHRAIDVVADPVDAARELAAVGVDRILTSGGGATSIHGVRTLRRLVDEVGAAVEIMAGGGVAVGDIPELADAGVAAVHLSARSRAETSPSGPGGGASSVAVTDPATVEAAVTAARAWRYAQA